MSWDQELDEFKREHRPAGIRGIAGLQPRRARERPRRAAVMRHSNGDKIFIKRDTDSHYIFFSVHDKADNGTIIEFVQNRNGGQGRFNIGRVRKLLRPWIGRAAAIPVYPELVRSTRDRAGVELLYQTMAEAPDHPYLLKARKIPAAILASDRFAGRVRIDERNNAIFPHFDAKGLCGFEMKNKGFTGFSTGGTKGLWLSHAFDGDMRLIFTEAAIDALSHAALFPAPEARYASIGGQLNPTQPELISAEILRMPPGSEIIAAMDNDEAGLE